MLQFQEPDICTQNHSRIITLTVTLHERCRIKCKIYERTNPSCRWCIQDITVLCINKQTWP
uniref:Uncharacterized protein n=1 Tax=Cannabis sativa TaxID=3483 RepID=A0A803QV28_CANSA